MLSDFVQYVSTTKHHIMVKLSLCILIIFEKRYAFMGGIFLWWLFIGVIAVALVVSTSTIERTLKSIREQNNTIIELLKEINKKR